MQPLPSRGPTEWARRAEATLGGPGCEVLDLSTPLRRAAKEVGAPHSLSAPDYDKSQWLDVKFKLDLDFPNLPYLMDGKNKITQSNAILRYIARKHNMCGETEEERIRVDIMENQIMDFRIQLVQLCYSPDLEKLKPRYLEQLPGQLKQFSLFLGKFSWFAGEKLTFVDFLTYDVLDQNRMFEPKCLDEFPNLKAFMCRFEALEKIANYMQSDRFLKMPINNKMALWGNKRIC
uniref:Glutathione S-transferase n=1 Tax=Canis lupus familiaris TaxID=9615 RepID=A0A8I3RQS4_CANLF